MTSDRPYEKLKFYQKICEIRKLIHTATASMPKENMRLISQMRDAARSAKQNIREGYRKGSLGEFLHYIRISQGSLEELCGDMDDCLEDKLIAQDQYNKFMELFKSAMYLSSQYLKAMSNAQAEKRWTTPLTAYKENLRIK